MVACNLDKSYRKTSLSQNLISDWLIFFDILFFVTKFSAAKKKTLFPNNGFSLPRHGIYAGSWLKRTL